LNIDNESIGFKKNGKSDMLEGYADRNNDDMGGFYRGRVLAVSDTLKKIEPKPAFCDGFRRRDERDTDQRQVQSQRPVRIGGDEVSAP